MVICRRQPIDKHISVWSCLIMITFGSCHLIIDRDPIMIVGTFMTLEMLIVLVGRYLYFYSIF